MHEVVQALSYVGLLIGTLAYAMLVRRRVHVRNELDATAATGLQGLVRVLAADYRVEGS